MCASGPKGVEGIRSSIGAAGSTGCPMVGATGCTTDGIETGDIERANRFPDADGEVFVRDYDAKIIAVPLSTFKRDCYAASWRLSSSGIPETERALMRLAWNAGYVIDQLLSEIENLQK